MRILGRDAQGVAADGAIFFARQVFGRVGRQAIDRGDKLKRSLRPGQSITLHEVLGQEEIPDSRQNRHEQNADGAFALVEQAAHEFERPLQIPFGQGIAQFENDAGTREWNEIAHMFHRDLPFAAQENINLLEFVLDLPGIATG